MRIVKTPKTFLISRRDGAPGERHLVVGVGLAFTLDDPSDLIRETTLWKAIPEELAAPPILDPGFAKPFGELLVAGSAVAPEGTSASAMRLSFSVGAIRRDLAVFGDRHWQMRGGIAVFSEPAPFQKLKLTPTLAFGGESYRENPHGRGHGAATLLSMGLAPPLPNIERAGALIQHVDDMPLPAIAGAVDLMAPSRQSLAGTYDAAWVATRRPALPLDADPRFFQSAQPEQRLAKGFFTGDEEFELIGMHARHQQIRGRLPGLRARAFARLRGPDDARPVFTEIILHCDTVWLLGTALMGATIWRGLLPVTEFDAGDVEVLMLAVERLGDEPLSHEHYQEQMRLRTDRKTAGLYALRQIGLMPPPSAAWLAEREEKHAALRKEIEARHARTMAYGLRQITDKVDPALAELVPPIEPKPLPSDYPVVTTEEIESGDMNLEAVLEYSEKRIAEAREASDTKGLVATLAAIARGEEPALDNPKHAEVAKSFASAMTMIDGLPEHYDPRFGKAVADVPPHPGAEIKAKLAESLGQLDKPVARRAESTEAWEDVRDRALGRQSGIPAALKARMLQTIDKAADALDGRFPGQEAIGRANPKAVAALHERMSKPSEAGASKSSVAKLFADGPLILPHASDDAKAVAARAKDSVTAAFAEIDAARPGRLPLQEVLAKITAQSESAPPDRAAMESAIEKADEAIRAGRSKLNVARRVAHKATRPDAPYSPPIALQLGALAAAEHAAGRPLTDLDFAGAQAALADFRDAEARGSFWERADLAQTDWTGAELADAVFSEAVLTEAVFTGCDLRGVNFSGAHLSATNFSMAALDRAQFGGADLTNAILDGASLGPASLLKTKLAGTSFRDAKLDKISFIDCDLSGADFSGARLERCIFMRSSLTDALAKGATFIRCAFIETDAQRIDLTGAQFDRTGAPGGGQFQEASFKGVKAPGTTWIKVDFTGADFTGADFTGAVMQEAVFTEARMQGSIFRQAVLTKANLRDARLATADFFATNLQRADLSNCDLRGANLYAANMEGAKLDAADLTGANLHTTMFSQATP